MTMRVVYRDGKHDMISTVTFEQLIESEEIRMFYRCSEDRWVVVGVDPIRKASKKKDAYRGPERRMEELIAGQLL